MPPLTLMSRRREVSVCAPCSAYNPLYEEKLHSCKSGSAEFCLKTKSTTSPQDLKNTSTPSSLVMEPQAIIPTNQPISSTAIPTVNDCLINPNDQLSSSDYHSFSSNDPPEHNNQTGRSCQFNTPICSDDPLSSHHPSLMTKPQNDKALLDNHAISSSVPFKWEEAPGKPIPTSTIEMGGHSGNLSYASPLQLPPKLQPQAYHSLLLQSPCRIDNCVDGSPAAINHQYIPRKVQPIYQARPPDHHSPRRRRLRLLHQSSPFAEPSAFPQSPYVLQQKLKKVCSSFLHSASWSQQTLHKFAPPCSRFAFHGSSVDETEEEKKVTNYDRFFFDTTSHKDFNHSASMDARKPTWSSFSHESERRFPPLPIFDKSQTEEDFVSRDALRFLAMEDFEAESIDNSSPWQPILVHERQGSGLFSWPAASNIMSLHDTDDDEGFHDCFSPKSSLQDVSQRIEDADHTEMSACSTPLPWFLDFSPNEEENHHVVSKASNKMSLVRLLALIKLKSTLSDKVCKLKRKGEREGALYAQEKSMWSPTLATYFYNNLHKREASMKLENTPTPHYVSEDSEQSSPDEGPLRINYHLPTMIKGQLISNHYYLDADLVSPHQVMSLPATSTCPSFNSAHDEKNPKQAVHRLSLREQLAQLNDEYLCPEQTKEYPADGSVKKRGHAHGCKGMCKLRKTVQVLATSIKLIARKLDDGKKGAKRPSLHHCSSLKTIFPLSSPHT